MKLPSFNKRQFIAHIKRGPGFGCWKQSRIDRAWGKKPRRVTAKDMARRILRTTEVRYKQIYLMISMLNEPALIELFKKLNLNHPYVTGRASRWAHQVTRRSLVDVTREVLKL